MNRKKLVIACTLAIQGMAAVFPAHAGEREDMEALRQTTLAIVDALVAKGILTEESAREMIAQAEQKGREKAQALAQAEAQAQPEAKAGVVRVPYIPEVVKRELREQIRQEVVAQAKNERWGDVNVVPEWIDRLKWEGDFRLRYQMDRYAEGNAAPATFQATGVNLQNTGDDRERWRVRARLGLLAKITDDLSAGFRLTTGNTSDPVSTNQTLGSSFNKNSLVLDRAYVKATPLEWLGLSGGRIPNPFFGTDLVWDDDLNFDGVALSLTPWARESMSVKPFFTVGAFPLQEVESSPANKAKDKWLYAAQAGLDWRAGPYSRWRVGLAYYDYRGTTGVLNASPLTTGYYDASAPGSHQKGNSLYVIDTDANNDGTQTDPVWGLAADYRLANLTVMADLAHFDPVHAILTADVVKNLGYDERRTAGRMGIAGYAPETLGWNVKLTVGMPNVQLKDDWQLFAGYRHLERDAVFDAYTDSDFALGGTDNAGYYLGGAYGLARNAWLGFRYLSSDSLSGLPFGVDVLQMDFNARF